MKDQTRIATTSQQRAQEALWIESCHPDWGLVLMELAGRTSSKAAQLLWKHNPGQVAIFCGRGNNGGDGFVVARYLYLCGVPVSVHAIEGVPSRDNSVNREILNTLGVQVNTVDYGNLEPIKKVLSESVLAIDALLGTGLDRAVEGIYKEVIDTINNSDKPVVSIDVPSGVNSDTGQIMGCAVKATATVTFGYLKAGLLCYPGAELRGELHLADIGLPPLETHLDALQDKSDWRLATAHYVRNLLPARPQAAHKGTFGYVLTIAGSQDMMGAAHLASKTALKAGSGLSVLATPKSLLHRLPADEVICRGISETQCATIGLEAIADLKPELERASAIILGPGLSLNSDTIKFVHEIVNIINKPCLIDADGLNAISQDPKSWPKFASNFVLTPHPKELARLMNVAASEVQADRIAFAQKASDRYQCTVVLKGALSVIANYEQKVFINPTGNSGMATAGSGDVLSGIIGGLMAQGLEPFEAAVAGTYIHGLAGDMAADELGETGIVSGDIARLVPLSMSEVRTGDFCGSNLEACLLEGDEP